MRNVFDLLWRWWLSWVEICCCMRFIDLWRKKIMLWWNRGICFGGVGVKCSLVFGRWWWKFLCCLWSWKFFIKIRIRGNWCGIIVILSWLFCNWWSLICNLRLLLIFNWIIVNWLLEWIMCVWCWRISVGRWRKLVIFWCVFFCWLCLLC